MTIRQKMYPKYFRMNIHKRINERQERNSLNINGLFSTVISDSIHSEYTTEYPKINNGMYHHIGKTHSKYPKK